MVKVAAKGASQSQAEAPPPSAEAMGAAMLQDAEAAAGGTADAVAEAVDADGSGGEEAAVAGSDSGCDEEEKEEEEGGGGGASESGGAGGSQAGSGSSSDGSESDEDGSDSSSDGSDSEAESEEAGGAAAKDEAMAVAEGLAYEEDEMEEATAASPAGTAPEPGAGTRSGPGEAGALVGEKRKDGGEAHDGGKRRKRGGARFLEMEAELSDEDGGAAGASRVVGPVLKRTSVALLAACAGAVLDAGPTLHLPFPPPPPLLCLQACLHLFW